MSHLGQVLQRIRGLAGFNHVYMEESETGSHLPHEGLEFPDGPGADAALGAVLVDEDGMVLGGGHRFVRMAHRGQMLESVHRNKVLKAEKEDLVEFRGSRPESNIRAEASLLFAYGAGLVMVLVAKVTAAMRANNRPSTLAPVFSEML